MFRIIDRSGKMGVGGQENAILPDKSSNQKRKWCEVAKWLIKQVSADVVVAWLVMLGV
jgi:hypothetical protein